MTAPPSRFRALLVSSRLARRRELVVGQSSVSLVVLRLAVFLVGVSFEYRQSEVESLAIDGRDCICDPLRFRYREVFPQAVLVVVAIAVHTPIDFFPLLKWFFAPDARRRRTLRGANRRIAGQLRVSRHIITLGCRAGRSRRRSAFLARVHPGSATS